ncbi:unnamed protein product [Somion occarium]|uniref:Uncharacterized protein n=1 Tax=Somion occarium TaxID=3059160 RepID=A0ABP1D796_9APHY
MGIHEQMADERSAVAQHFLKYIWPLVDAVSRSLLFTSIYFLLTAMLLLLLIFLALSTSTLALPVMKQTSLELPRTTLTPWCDGLGAGAFSIAHNFTLAAYNATVSTAEPVGIPLVLGQIGAIAGAELKVLSPYSSYPHDDFSTFFLMNGALFSKRETGLTALNSYVSDGREPNFIVSTFEAPDPARNYCALANISPHGTNPNYPILAVNGDINGFSLCDSRHAGIDTTVVYKPKSSDNSLYNVESCYPVHLRLWGLY